MEINNKSNMMITPVELDFYGECISGTMVSDDTHQAIICINKDDIIIWKRKRANNDEEWEEWSKPNIIK